MRTQVDVEVGSSDHAASAFCAANAREHVPGGTADRSMAAAAASDLVALADICRRLSARQVLARPAAWEVPTAANLPGFLKEVRNGAAVGHRRPALRRAVLRAAVLPGLALLSWLAWDSAPPRDWLRPVGPAAANSEATRAGLELTWATICRRAPGPRADVISPTPVIEWFGGPGRADRHPVRCRTPA